eukprot:349949-Chlamydomonas_euryale.AAC.2
MPVAQPFDSELSQDSERTQSPVRSRSSGCGPSFVTPAHSSSSLLYKCVLYKSLAQVLHKFRVSLLYKCCATQSCAAHAATTFTRKQPLSKSSLSHSILKMTRDGRTCISRTYGIYGIYGWP